MKNISGKNINDLNKLKISLSSWLVYYSTYDEIKNDLNASIKIAFIEVLLSPRVKVVLKSETEESIYAKLNDELRKEYWNLQELTIKHTKKL